MDDYITRKEHDEFSKRIDEENHRQNRRLELLEKNVQDMHTLTVSVSKMAEHMENIDHEQEKQGKRLEVIEGRDGDRWRQVVGYVITAVIGIVIGFIFKRIGM